MGEPFPGLGPKVSGPVDGQAPLQLPLIPWMGAASRSVRLTGARLGSLALASARADLRRRGQSEVGEWRWQSFRARGRWFESTVLRERHRRAASRRRVTGTSAGHPPQDTRDQSADAGPDLLGSSGCHAGCDPFSVVLGGPADGVEHGDGVEVVAPACDLAVLDRDDGDEVVVVGVPGADRSAVDCVFQDDD